MGHSAYFPRINEAFRTRSYALERFRAGSVLETAYIRYLLKAVSHVDLGRTGENRSVLFY